MTTIRTPSQRLEASWNGRRLGPGIYKLTKDVDNPGKPDKRVKREWNKCAVLPAGTVIIVEVDPYFQERAHKPLRLRINERFSSVHAVMEHNPWFTAIAESAPEPHEDLSSVLCLHHESPHGILERLITMGRISLQDVKNAIEAERRDNDEEPGIGALT